MAVPAAKQLNWSKVDLDDLRDTIREDWSTDSRDMQARNNLYVRLYRLWEAVSETHNFPEQERSNFHIPLTEWQCLAKLAKELDALLGDDSEVTARPVGPSDVERAIKIARYMNWRVKVSLKLFKKLYDYLLQKIVLGTSIAYVPWAKRERLVRSLVLVEQTVNETEIDPVTGLEAVVPRTIRTVEEREETVTDFEGPDIIVESIEDWAIPGDVKTLEEANHFERRIRLTVDEMLDMTDEGRLSKKVFTDEVIRKLRRFAETGTIDDETASDSGKQLRDEKSELTGTESIEGRNVKLTVINWFGLHRKKSAKPEDRAEKVVAFYQPDTQLLLGASRLVDLFPDGRWPFVKSEAIRNFKGPWGKGLPELLESINMEMDVQHNALTDASVFALGPVIFYSPASGLNPETFKFEPFTCVPTADPDKVKPVSLASINLAPYVTLQANLLAAAERVTGLTDPELGRQLSSPNAPRTLGQQQLIQAGSGVRLLLDLRLERESLRELLNRIWDLDRRYLPDQIFFRVSEAEPFEVMTKEEMQGNYDFDIGPLTSTANKAQEAAAFMQGYAIVAQNPVVMQNLPLQAALAKEVFRIMGRPDLARSLPDYSQMAPPMSPEDENAKLLQGEDVDPHPQDNHAQHIAKHTAIRDFVAEGARAGAIRDPNAVGRFDSHIAEHERVAQNAAPAMAQGGKPNGGAGMVMPSDQTGVPNEALNDLKGMLNQGGGNLG